MGGFAYLVDGASAVASPEVHHVATGAVAATLGWTGAVKVRRPLPAAWALVDFGIVRRVKRRAGLVLGLVEGGLAVALAAGLSLGGARAATATAAAALLFLAFGVVIARSLRRGARFECACFGRGSPLSRTTLARAVFLAAVSTVLAATAPTTAPLTDAAETFAALMAGTAIVACSTLLALTPRLLRWNADPFGLDLRHSESWGSA